MPSIPIIMPQLGESIAEATVVNLLVKPVATRCEADQDIIEVETSKATMNVASPCPGRVEKLPGQAERELSRRRRAGHIASQPGRRRAAGSGCRRAGQDARTIPTRLAKAERERRVANARPADRARSARAGQCRRRQLHVPAHEGAHDGTGPARGRPGGPARQRRRRARDHPGLREVHRQSGEAQAEPGLDHARGRRRCHAAQLDAAAGDGRSAGLLRPAA